MSKPLQVLLVEDNEDDVAMIQRALHQSEVFCNLSMAHDGHEALDFLHSCLEKSDMILPHLILLDLEMPRMNGKQFLAQMKADARIKVIPIVMFTGSSSPDDVRDCYNLQASSYVVKPSDPEIFTQTVCKVLTYWGSVARAT
jgi:CheY-like chemotaxis protein